MNLMRWLGAILDYGRCLSDLHVRVNSCIGDHCTVRLQSSEVKGTFNWKLVKFICVRSRQISKSENGWVLKFVLSVSFYNLHFAIDFWRMYPAFIRYLIAIIKKQFSDDTYQRRFEWFSFDRLLTIAVFQYPVFLLRYQYRLPKSFDKINQEVIVESNKVLKSQQRLVWINFDHQSEHP